MRVKLIKIGNSVGFTIPHQVVKEYGLKIGDEVDLEFSTAIDPKTHKEIRKLTMIVIDKYLEALEELAKR